MTHASISTRRRLLLGVSVAAIALSNTPAGAQDVFRRPARDAAAQAAQAAAGRAMQNQASAASTRRTIEAFQRAASLRQQMDAAQIAARAQAMALQSFVPNGLGPGGLQVANGVQTDPSLWIGAGGPTQTTADGRTRVEIDQTQSRAILTWDSFNVGRETDLVFDQQGNTNWAVLNRVTDVSADPSRILGSIRADGTVMILNRNGVIFGGSSQVNARNIVAAAATMSNDQFLERGIYSAQQDGAYVAAFTGAAGAVKVEAGARIATTAPTTVVEGGGYVLLMGASVENAGSITTSKGQTLLAAGDHFLVRPGFGTDGNDYSTTRGNEVRAVIDGGGASGHVANTGAIEATRGDITLTGRQVVQDGVLLSTTSVNQRGTIHLTASLTDAESQVILTGNSLTAVLPELDSDETALDSQRDVLVEASKGVDPSFGGQFDNRARVPDRRDRSRVEIVSGGDIVFEGGSTTLAQGGQVAAQATRRVQAEDGAIIDVSGVRGVALDIGSNAIKVNIQGNELRDSPLNRDAPDLKNQDVWIDVRDLILVPDGTGGYEGDRYYTGGGLLEVGGYIGNTAHTIGEWASVGGTITLVGAEVVAQRDAVFNIAGGSLDYAAGSILSTRLQGADGKLYDINDAPAGMKFVSVGRAQVVGHARWGEQYAEVYSNAMFNRGVYVRREDAYTVGRDAGQLILSAPTVLFDGEVVADVIAGTRQVNDRPAGVADGYKLGQSQAALAGRLVLRDITKNTGPTEAPPGYLTDVRLADDVESVTGGLTLGDAAPEDRVGTAWFDTDRLNGYGLGGLEITTAGALTLDSDLTLAVGGELIATAPVIDLNGVITARSGHVSLANYILNPDGSGAPATIDGARRITLRSGAAIDTRGVWVNQLLDPNAPGLAHVNGGSVTLASPDDVILEAGSLIDVSSGGALLADGSVKGGRGGDVKLIANEANHAETDVDGLLVMDGVIRGYGMAGGGTLTIQNGRATVISDTPVLADGVLHAGEEALTELVLDEEVTVPEGATLALDYIEITVIDRVAAGEAIPAGAEPAVFGFEIAGPWTVPEGSNGVLDVNENFFAPGDTISAGTRLSLVISLPEGFVVPAEAFPDGFPITPITTSRTYAAGTPAPTTVTYAAGTRAPTGTIFAQDVAIRPILNVSPDTFGSGFSNYVVESHTGVVVTDGTRLDVSMPVYRLTADAFTTPTSGETTPALEVWTPPVYLEDSANARLTQRAGANLTLSSSPVSGYGAGVRIGTGTVLSVDPGAAVNIRTNGQLTVDGTIRAAGGAITLHSLAQGEFDVPPALSVWIGENAVLDVSAEAAVATDRRGRSYGFVSDGGSISIGSAGQIAFVVIREGAVLDASGASAVLNPFGNAGGTVLPVASDGGGISLGSRFGILNDGVLRAAAGGEGASGGSLSLTINARHQIGSFVPPPAERVNYIISVGEDFVGSGLGAEIRPGQVDPTLAYGQARISDEQIKAGGFDSLELSANTGLIRFEGSVALDLGRSLTLNGVIGSDDAASAVRLSAPYVLLSGYSAASGNTQGAPGESEQATTATLSISADLIDIRDVVTFGGGGLVVSENGEKRPYDLAGFADIELASRGDMRFLASKDSTSNLFADRRVTMLRAPGDLTLTAAQIYPGTAANASIYAGSNPLMAESVLTIRRAGEASPATPFSVFGDIAFYASVIDQGGIVRAPLGTISFGSEFGGRPVREIRLLSGSLTSVSAAGLTMPFGGTSDGVEYTYNGKTFALGAGAGTPDGGKIHLQAAQVIGEEGSTIDLSGGGELAGAAFVSGRGGSVDILTTPLVNANPALDYSDAGNAVYAIVPGYASDYAPFDPASGAAPGIGRQITIPEGVPGLPAGVYTLLPARYALLSGGFRVELGGLSELSGVVPTGDGSYHLSGGLGVANTGVRDSTSVAVTLTPGAEIRQRSKYDETTYSQFAVARAATLGQLRPALTADAKTLTILFQDGANGEALVFNGKTLFEAGKDGRGGSVNVGYGNFAVGRGIEVFGSTMTEGYDGISIRDSTLNALDAARVTVGGTAQTNDVFALSPSIVFVRGSATKLDIRGDAALSAPEIFLTAGTINVEAGARISTVGQGDAPYDSDDGYQYMSMGTVLALSNGWINFQPPTGVTPGGINIGVCPSGACVGDAQLLSDGTLALVTGADVRFEDASAFGARYLSLNVAAMNIGEASAMAGAVVPPGFQLDQATLDRLLKGDPTLGTPRLERLNLGAGQSINFYGTVGLNTIDPTTGESYLDELVLTTPAIYGYGDAGDVATITTDTLYWNSLVANAYFSVEPGPVLAGGPGTGAGTLNIDAKRIEFGVPGTMLEDRYRPVLNRLALGFSTVNLTATDRITANSRGSFSVYQSQGDYVQGSGYTYSGGTLNLITPLLTGGAGSILDITAGGAMTLDSPTGPAAGTDLTGSLGAEINLKGATITQRGTRIGLASGRLSMEAEGDILLADGSVIDLAGREITLVDQVRYSWGGDLELKSDEGDIVQMGGSTIDVSAVNNVAGSVTAEALGAGTGRVDLAGLIKGGASGEYDIGAGVIVPYAGGRIDIRAQTIADFTGLNGRLNANGVTGARTFMVKQGDLTIGDEVKARYVTIVADGGSLTVNGRIDASGAQVGSIRLAARDDLTLAQGAVLDAHGSVLRIDSYGKPIDASNRATVELTAAGGTLSLSPGSVIDVRSADAVSRGTVALNAPRRGDDDIAVEAGAGLDIRGARTVALNGFRSYDDAPLSTEPTVGGRPTQIITQAYLDAIDLDSRAFIDAAAGNGGLQARIAGLRAQGDAFHLQPGVEIRSATEDGDLSVQGDLDLSGYRYGAEADRDPNSIGYGAGDVGVLVLRAGGDLNIYGSITDGFGRPVTTPDDNGWVLPTAISADLPVSQEDLRLPRSLTLAAGSRVGGPVDFAFRIGETQIGSNQTVGAEVVLASAVTAPDGGFVARAAITLPDGRTFARGEIVPAGTELPPGTVLGAGSVLPSAFTIQAMLWPAGVELVSDILAEDTTVPAGAVLPVGSGLAGFVTYDENGERVVSSFMQLRDPQADGSQGRIWASAPMLAPGTDSWSMRLVAGADLASADTRTLRTDRVGDIILADNHYSGVFQPTQIILPNDNGVEPGSQDAEFWCSILPEICGPGPDRFKVNSILPSVIRTGTGGLELLAGGDYVQSTLYGVYTAGTQSESVDARFQLPRGADDRVLADGAVYQAWYPELGGDLLLSTGGDITTFGTTESNFVGNWLWRQGGGIVDQSTAWWINFGVYTIGANEQGDVFGTVTGFKGIGTLGGGNLTVVSGGDIGTALQVGSSGFGGEAIDFAVGGTGRVTSVEVRDGVVRGGTLELTGGGDVVLRARDGVWAGGLTTNFGTVTNVRGAVGITAGSIGGLQPGFGNASAADPRAPDPLENRSATAYDGLILVLGDSSARLDARRDLVLARAGDPGFLKTLNEPGFTYVGEDGSGFSTDRGGETAFRLWQAGTSIDLFSAGGDLTPMMIVSTFGTSPSNQDLTSAPPIFRAVAASGDIYARQASVTLAPSPLGQLELLARGSIYAGESTFSMSGAASDVNSQPNPFRPLFSYVDDTLTNPSLTNSVYNGIGYVGFTPDTPVTRLTAADPIRFYAAEGDIVGLMTGGIMGFPPFLGITPTTWYLGSRPVRMIAGRDIVMTNDPNLSGNLAVHNNPTDITTISAGRDIYYARFDVAGPGLLEVVAGRNVYQGDRGELHSIGPIVDIDATTRNGGAEIAVIAGVGEAGPNYEGFAKLYLDPANLAQAERPLADQPGKVVKVYDEELVAWLSDRYPADRPFTKNGETFVFSGEPAEALAFFLSLPTEQQGVFVRQVYYDELKAGGREYSGKIESGRFNSYLRGRQAIAALFPDKDPAGNALTYQGDITMFSSLIFFPDNPIPFRQDAGIRTDFGGGIQLLAPGGRTVIGVEGVLPGADAGLVTQGSGDIDIYSEGSILLGLSRIMTTFGGSILAWSAEGDINAGRGAKTTIVFTPPRRTYDAFGNVSLAPTVPSSGAGIATLDPIPEVPAGDVDLIAPLGTIDAGEAGIRVSGDINLAALHIVNAANIEVKGDATGIPVTAAVDTGALTAASSAANSAIEEATRLAERARPQPVRNIPAIITVQFVGFGE